MTTKRQAIRFSVLAVSLMLMLSTVALAHGDQQHVMGTVTKVENGSISVKTTTGEVKVVMILPSTKFVRGSSAATQEDVKVGERVVIHAKPEGNMLHATEVKIGGMNDSTQHD